MNQKTVSLILAFLNSNKTKIFSSVQTSIKEGHIPYTCMTFNYMGKDLKVCVYNESFIKIHVDGKIWAICDSVKTVRNSMYQLESYNYDCR